VFGIPTSLDGIDSYDLLPLPARRELSLRAQTPTESARSEDESVASFYTRHFGPATVDLIAAPLLGGIHAGDVSRLSVQAVAPRLVDAVSTGSLWRSAAPPAHGGDGLFRALEGGMSEIVDAIALRFPPGSVRLNTDARRVSRSNDGWTIDYVDGRDHTTTSLAANAAIIATPAHAAAAILSNTDVELSALCAEVPYVSTASVALAWPRSSISHPLSGSGFVVAHELNRPRITACTWVSSKWEHRAPEGTTLLRAFLGGATDPDVLNLPDDALVGIATLELSAVLGITGPSLMSRVFRWPRAGAQHVVGHAQRLDRIDARLASLPQLFLSGSGFHSIGLPDCIADGRATAIKAIASLR
jgi:oxygen-dependent protoporphyrinogen oxidase